MALFRLEDYQLRELKENKIYINKYDCSIMYDYEMAKYLKEFYFDVLMELSIKEGLVTKGILPTRTKDYLKIIKKYHLKTDIEDYIEITDNMLFKDWSKIGNNKIVYDTYGNAYLYSD